MFKSLFSPKELSISEEKFLKNISAYLIKNCRAIYGEEYIPRLVQRICRTRNIDVELHKGFIHLRKNNKNYSIPYAYNMYKGNIIDLNLFVVKSKYQDKKYVEGSTAQFTEKSIFDNLPDYLLWNTTDIDLIMDTDIQAYESTKLITNDIFQPNNIITDDKLILAIYNNCYASSIAVEVLEKDFNVSDDITASLNYISWGSFEY